MSIWRKRRPTNQASPLLDMIQGYRATCLIAAAMQLDLFERMAAGPVAAEALGERARRAPAVGASLDPGARGHRPGRRRCARRRAHRDGTPSS